MADYHPLIARAVAGLDKNSGENRRALYERARVALVAQLRGVAPALEESEITRERLALEEAIRKVEAEAARHARDALRLQPSPRRAEAPRTISPRTPVTPGVLGQHRPIDQPDRGSIAPPPEAADDQARNGRRDASVRSSGASASRPAPSQDVEERLSARRRDASPPPEQSALAPYGQLEPQLQSENLWPLPLDGGHPEAPVDLDANQPPPSQRYVPRDEPEDHGDDDVAPRPPRSYGGMIRVGIVLVLIAVIAALGFWQRTTIAGIAGGVIALFHAPSAPAPRDAAAPARPKITDRLGQPSSEPSNGPPVAQRVVLYEEEPDDPQGKRFVGTVLWKTEMRPASPGRAPEMAVRADVSVPERNMTMTFSLRRNTDPSLPASHTIEIVFTLPADSPTGGVQKVPGVLMKQSESTRGVPLAGLAVPVTPGYFLIGLSSIEADMQRNIQLLKERPWFDIPIIYNNNRRAILAMEKGPPGEQAFAQAFAAWKQ